MRKKRTFLRKSGEDTYNFLTYQLSEMACRLTPGIAYLEKVLIKSSLFIIFVFHGNETDKSHDYYKWFVKIFFLSSGNTVVSQLAQDCI